MDGNLKHKCYDLGQEEFLREGTVRYQSSAFALNLSRSLSSYGSWLPLSSYFNLFRSYAPGFFNSSELSKAHRNDTPSNYNNQKWSGRHDLNMRPLGPKPSVLPNWTTPRKKWRCLRDLNPWSPAWQAGVITTTPRHQMVTSMGFEPMNAAVKGQCVKPLHQLAITVAAQLLGRGIKFPVLLFCV